MFTTHYRNIRCARRIVNLFTRNILTINNTSRPHYVSDRPTIKRISHTASIQFCAHALHFTDNTIHGMLLNIALYAYSARQCSIHTHCNKLCAIRIQCWFRLLLRRLGNAWYSDCDYDYRHNFVPVTWYHTSTHQASTYQARSPMCGFVKWLVAVWFNENDVGVVAAVFAFWCTQWFIHCDNRCVCHVSMERCLTQWPRLHLIDGRNWQRE